jgi:DNA-binding XRE family transcriptional regulator
MDADKKRRLEAGGWRVGSAEELLGLTPHEAAFIELRLSLASALKERRKERRLSQCELAGRIGSSQSRVAKMEAGDPSVTVDLLVRALLALGASPTDLAKAILAA